MRQRLALCLVTLLVAGQAQAATYYVKASGADANTGLSDSQAWATPAYAGSQASPGDKILLKVGDTFAVTSTATVLHIDVANTTWGAYYVSGGEIECAQGDSHCIDRPNLDSDNVSFGGGVLQPLVDVRAVGTIISDLEITDSYGYGMRLAANSSSQTNPSIFSRLRINNTYGTAWYSSYGNHYYIIQDCELSNSWSNGYNGQNHWGSTLRANGSHGIVRRNRVWHGFGEGINLYGASHMLVEDNLISDHHSVLLYLDSTDNSIIRRNVVIGTSSPDPLYSYEAYGRSMSGIGLNIEQEANGVTEGNHVYANVVINCYTGVQVLNRGTYNPTGVPATIKNEIHNNTLIANRFNLRVEHDLWTEFRNNISYAFTSDDSDHTKSSTNWPNVSFWGTLWYGDGTRHTGYDHANDVVGDPGFVKTSGWRTISTISGYNPAADFAVHVNGAGVDTAQTAASSDGVLSGTDYSANPIAVLAGPQGDFGEGWDFGAFIYNPEGSPSCGPSGCDTCLSTTDTDGDGVVDDCDVCPGADDTLDDDADGHPDACDRCPIGDDTLDGDADGIPDACDQCPLGDDGADVDGDGVADMCDVCPGGGDGTDADADGVPDGCDTNGSGVALRGAGCDFSGPTASSGWPWVLMLLLGISRLQRRQRPGALPWALNAWTRPEHARAKS